MKHELRLVRVIDSLKDAMTAEGRERGSAASSEVGGTGGIEDFAYTRPAIATKGPCSKEGLPRHAVTSGRTG